MISGLFASGDIKLEKHSFRNVTTVDLPVLSIMSLCCARTFTPEDICNASTAWCKNGVARFYKSVVNKYKLNNLCTFG